MRINTVSLEFQAVSWVLARVYITNTPYTHTHTGRQRKAHARQEKSNGREIRQRYNRIDTELCVRLLALCIQLGHQTKLFNRPVCIESLRCKSIFYTHTHSHKRICIQAIYRVYVGRSVVVRALCCLTLIHIFAVAAFDPRNQCSIILREIQTFEYGTRFLLSPS